MAIEKEATIQKTTGIILLTLTLSLALRVDSILLDQLIVINEYLQTSALSAQHENRKSLLSIQLVSTVENQHRLATTLKMKAEKVSTSALEVFSVLKQLRKKMMLNENIKNSKGTTEAHFQRTPTLLALALLSRLEIEVTRTETNLLKAITVRIEANAPSTLTTQRCSLKKTRSSDKACISEWFNTETFYAKHQETNTTKSNGILGFYGIDEVPLTTTENNAYIKGYTMDTSKGSIGLKTPNGNTTYTVSGNYVMMHPTLRRKSSTTQKKVLTTKCRS